MSVKTIFWSLFITVITIVLGTATVEMFNLQTTSLQVQQITKMGARQACVLFSQETYKQHGGVNGDGGTINMDDVENTDGGEYVSGKFYDSTDATEIYKQLYTNSTEYQNWVNSSEIQSANWHSLRVLNKALQDPDIDNLKYGDPDYEERATGKLYKEVMMTPSNLGIPYLDEETLNRMFKWNTAQLLSNCNSKSIRQDENGHYFVAFKGFRIYADEAKITNLEYKVFDLEDSSDRIQFRRLTNINPDKLGFLYDSNLGKTISAGDDERKRVCLVGVQYSVPITYEGITPLKSIFNYVQSQEVNGFNGTGGRNIKETYEYDKQTFKAGGLEGDPTGSGVLPVPGELLYYVIR